MTRIYLPVRQPEEWRRLLTDPEKQWKKGFSAWELAHAWQDAADFPDSVEKVLNNAPDERLHSMELLIGLPEHEVPLPPRGHASQTDLFVLARDQRGGLATIAVEGKAKESFGPRVAEWTERPPSGKQERLAFLCDLLGLKGPDRVGPIRYQLLHRTGSALLGAQRFNAGTALMLVHSFAASQESLDDYVEFASLLGARADANEIVPVRAANGIDLFLGWVANED
jgi:Domain of unknown function (DUF6946)